MWEECPVLGWAASGGMALTGLPDGAPTVSPAAGFGLLGLVVRELAEATRAAGLEVRADPAELLAGRAALAGLSRRGRVSAGGSARLLRAVDGWCAVNLSRADDAAAVPAILGLLALPELLDLLVLEEGADGAGGAWELMERAAARTTASALAGAAQSLGVPAAALPSWPPVPGTESAVGAESGSGAESESGLAGRVTRVADRSPSARLAGAVVVDLSSMWAGPLCARLLGLAGAQVIKVETPERPDGARAGDHRFFDWLHAGHRSVVVDFRSASGRAALAALLETADVVIEASRPRALAALGLAPETIPHPDGRVWLSITGYGRTGADRDRVAFGDDAAVAGGLVGWVGDAAAEAEPVFCADAIADPLTGVAGALAVARSVGAGGGELIDLSMRAVAAAFAAAPEPDHGPHEVRADGLHTTVRCAWLGAEQAVLPPARPRPNGRAAELGADTDAVLSWLNRC
jgi:crotonobetainyl-CoA:carnitine CoA-transferase CaiB-like acyl-CoA transferase